MDADVHFDGIRRGDADAFGAWLSLVEHEVRVSLRSFAAVVDTEAVLQESLLRVWQAAGRIVPDGRPNALLRFAVRTARNVAISELRKRREASFDPETYERAVEHASLDRTDEAPDVLLRAATHDCIEELPAQAKRVIVARLENSGMVPDETLAERLTMRRNTFLQNVTRAKRALYECLRAKGIDLSFSPAGGGA